MLYIGIPISFLVSLIIGYKTRRFVFLFLDTFLGLGIGILNVYLYFVFTPPADVGLGIIALLPVLFILYTFFNVISALAGGIIGTVVARRKSSK